MHDLGRSAISPQQFGHDLHRAIYVLEESLVSGAEVVQARLPIRSLDEPVLRTLSVTRKTHFALPAIPWKRVTLIVPEFLLLLRTNEPGERFVAYVAKQVFRLDEVVAGIEITVVLDDVTNEELANAANLTPFTASRLLGAWQRRSVVKKSRGKILLRHPAGLFPQEL